MTRKRPFTWPFPELEAPVPPWDATACDCDWELCSEPCVVASATVVMSWARDGSLNSGSGQPSAPATETAQPREQEQPREQAKPREQLGSR
ncbi:hypothetical protein [Streptomyces olivochromogenes]|uniref:hypothetical protein n=1 Tax=Streptomyces olivochromogenes TaxID=1963 RepID=UPI001F1C74AA|nr:hypothetical protein [Streptomyces olivochromogenes]MCF3131068.1 hypothetical protein [Streptomyces olivochromogenes]